MNSLKYFITQVTSRLLFFATLFGFPALGSAQSLPSAQIWLVPLNATSIAGPPHRISPAHGYHNQPHFSPDSTVLYFTSEQADGQTDIWGYSMTERSLAAVNHSPESEYSPTPIPGHNAVSVIRVEPDQRQRLWRIELEDGQASLLLPNVEPVGYHTWFSGHELALFILGESFTLHTARVGPEPSVEVYKNIGRTLRRHPETGAVLFVDKNRVPWRVASIDTNTGKVTGEFDLFPGSEDFEIDQAGNYWTGNGSKLYLRTRLQNQWMLAADFSEFGIDNISRLAASPDGTWLALVSSP